MKAVIALCAAAAFLVACGQDPFVLDRDTRTPAYEEAKAALIARKGCVRDHYHEGDVVYRCADGMWSAWDLRAEVLRGLGR